jgi:hypothetical protein
MIITISHPATGIEESLAAYIQALVTDLAHGNDIAIFIRVSPYVFV